MKINCEVIAVETLGESLRVTLQGKPPKSADWRNLERQTIILPTTKSAERAFHIGRRFTLTLSPKGT